MTDETKETSGNCARKCGGCKFLAGVLVGLLIAGTVFGFYMAGRYSGKHMCPMTTMHGSVPPEPPAR